MLARSMQPLMSNTSCCSFSTYAAVITNYLCSSNYIIMTSCPDCIGSRTAWNPPFILLYILVTIAVAECFWQLPTVCACANHSAVVGDHPTSAATPCLGGNSAIRHRYWSVSQGCNHLRREWKPIACHAKQNKARKRHDFASHQLDGVMQEGIC